MFLKQLVISVIMGLLSSESAGGGLLSDGENGREISLYSPPSSVDCRMNLSVPGSVSWHNIRKNNHEIGASNPFLADKKSEYFQRKKKEHADIAISKCYDLALENAVNNNVKKQIKYLEKGKALAADAEYYERAAFLCQNLALIRQEEKYKYDFSPAIRDLEEGLEFLNKMTLKNQDLIGAFEKDLETLSLKNLPNLENQKLCTDMIERAFNKAREADEDLLNSSTLWHLHVDFIAKLEKLEKLESEKNTSALVLFLYNYPKYIIKALEEQGRKSYKEKLEMNNKKEKNSYVPQDYVPEDFFLVCPLGDYEKILWRSARKLQEMGKTEEAFEIDRKLWNSFEKPIYKYSESDGEYRSDGRFSFNYTEIQTTQIEIDIRTKLGMDPDEEGCIDRAYKRLGKISPRELAMIREKE